MNKKDNVKQGDLLFIDKNQIEYYKYKNKYYSFQDYLCKELTEEHILDCINKNYDIQIMRFV
jgi:hypothetical protein